ncbi:MAG TPA: hypothetical protein VHN11_18350 [Xanthobacteraceae bacterium]|jgi:predicted transcriptional regulator|nr:hypothetical protein [Xanthobacteraceae bacterium]
MHKQAASYPLRLPPHLREHYQRRADELDRSLHWVILKALEGAAEADAKEKALTGMLGS